MPPNINHLARGIAASGSILLADQIPSSSSDLVQVIERLGLSVVLVLFFIYTGWRRELRMAARIDKLEKDNANLAKQLGACSVRSREEQHD